MVDRIVSLAKEKGVTISAVEKEVGLSNGIIGKWRKQSPSCDKLKLVADYFNTTIDYLMTGENSNDNSSKYSELIEHLERLSASSRRHALADLMDILEEKYPIQ